MSLRHVILGWLNYEPMTGYDLNAVIEISTQHFWSTSQSQIYRTLAKLENASWVTQEVIQQEDRPHRKVYHITESGKSELKNWLSTFHEPNPPQIPFLIQVFFAGQIRDEDIAAVLVQKAANLRRRLGQIRAVRAISAGQFSPDEDIRNVFYWMLTMDYGETQLQDQINWIEKTIEKINHHAYEKMDLEKIRNSNKEMDKEHEQ